MYSNALQRYLTLVTNNFEQVTAQCQEILEKGYEILPTSMSALD